jgi:hypothetical protein
VEQGVERLREFVRQHGRTGRATAILKSRRWKPGRRLAPSAAFETEQRAGNAGLRREDYEKAARVRDALKNLESQKSATSAALSPVSALARARI